MKHYLYKLIPPRADFARTMTPEEMAVMQSHVGYWTNQMKLGNAIAFGPVSDPIGDYGIGIVQLADDKDPVTLRDGDPAMKANIGFRTEIFPMPMLVAKN